MAQIGNITRDLALNSSGDIVREERPMVAAMFWRLAVQRGSCFWDHNFGSRLHLIRKITPTTRVEIEDAAREALQPMVDARELSELAFSHSQTGVNRWNFIVDARDSRQEPMRLSLFITVGE